MIQYKRNIPIKAKDGTTLKSDNIRVQRPQIFERVQVAPGYGTEYTYVNASKIPSNTQESNVAAGAIRLARPMIQPIVRSIAATFPALGSLFGERTIPSNWILVPGTESIYRVPLTNGMVNYAKKPLSRAKAQKEQEIEAAMDQAYAEANATPPNDENKKDEQKNEEQKKPEQQNSEDKKPNWAKRAWNNLRKPISKVPPKVWSTYKWSWYIPAGLDVVGNVAGAITQGSNYSPDLRFLSGRSQIARGIGSVIGKGFQALGSTYAKDHNQPSDSTQTSNNNSTQTESTQTTIPTNTSSTEDLYNRVDSILNQAKYK